jgi:hypothetical protein
MLMTLVIRGLDEKTKRWIRAEAVKRGLKLSNAVKEAFQLWQTYNPATPAVSEMEANNATYSALREELDKYAGRAVLIAKGKLLGIYDTPRSAALDLRTKAPDAHHAIITIINNDKKEKLEWSGGSLKL